MQLFANIFPPRPGHLVTAHPTAGTPVKVKDLKLCKNDDEGSRACGGVGVLTLKWGQTRLSAGGPTVSGDLGLLQGLTPPQILFKLCN